MDTSMEFVGQAPVENSASDENAERCPICLESMEPFVLETSVRCSTCNAPYCATCLDRWLNGQNRGQNYRAEKCCNCRQTFPIVRPCLQAHHIVEVFINMEKQLWKRMYQKFKKDFKGLASRCESSSTLARRREVIADFSAYFQAPMSAHLTQIFNERYVQSVLPMMRSSEQVNALARQFLGKMCRVVVLHTMRVEAQAMLNTENYFREKRIDAMIKPLGLQLRQKFLASPAYTRFVKAQAKKLKDRFDDIRNRPKTKVVVDMENSLMAMMSRFTKGMERKKIIKELHSQVHARLVDSEFVVDNLELYAFYFNYEEDREDHKFLMSRFKRDIGDLVLAYRRDGCM